MILGIGSKASLKNNEDQKRAIVIEYLADVQDKDCRTQTKRCYVSMDIAMISLKQQIAIIKPNLTARLLLINIPLFHFIYLSKYIKGVHLMPLTISCMVKELHHSQGNAAKRRAIILNKQDVAALGGKLDHQEEPQGGWCQQQQIIKVIIIILKSSCLPTQNKQSSHIQQFDSIPRCAEFSVGQQKSSLSGDRTRPARVKTWYPNHIDQQGVLHTLHSHEINTLFSTPFPQPFPTPPPFLPPAPSLPLRSPIPALFYLIPLSCN